MKFLLALAVWVPLLQADSLLNDLDDARRGELERGGQEVIMQNPGRR